MRPITETTKFQLLILLQSNTRRLDRFIRPELFPCLISLAENIQMTKSSSFDRQHIVSTKLVFKTTTVKTEVEYLNFVPISSPKS